MNGNESKKSFGELPTLGREGTAKPEASDGEASWSARGLSEAETLRPPEGIRDDGRTDAAGRWKTGEEILGRYVVERELGQGGMGVVYGCLDKVSGIRVAVKCLPPELSHNRAEMEEIRENFELVYRLNHPNIAAVKTLEQDARGEYYLVMELAEGDTLRSWMRRKRKAGGMTVGAAAGVLRQVAAALDYAHGEKVVHRDVKPGNVMIDGKGRVKVLDFGLAAQIRTSLSRASQAYRGTSGTGPYMAPEQWRGKPQDGRADQYALGVMAYEMLAGHLPFDTPDFDVLRASVLNEEIDSIDGLSVVSMGAIRRAMAKQAGKRFPCCGDFVDALSGIGSTVPRPADTGGPDDAGWLDMGPLPPAGGEEAGGVLEKDVVPGPKTARLWGLVSLLLLVIALGAVGWWFAERKSVTELAERARAEVEDAIGLGKSGFGKKLDVMREELQRGERRLGRNSLADARESFQVAMRTAEWCMKNASLRDAAEQAKADADTARKKVQELGGYEIQEYREGNSLSSVAAEAYGKSQFHEAANAWKKAEAAYLEAVPDARANKVRKRLESARQGWWVYRLEAADEVLALDPDNKEAQAFKLKAQVDRGLEEATNALSRFDWDACLMAAEDVLALDRRNEEARKFQVQAKVGKGLAKARNAESREAWDECLKAANEVLALEGDNSEAQRLMLAAKVGPCLEAARKASYRSAWRDVIAAATEALALDADNWAAKKLKEEAERQMDEMSNPR